MSRLQGQAVEIPCDVSGAYLYSTERYRWLCKPKDAVQAVIDLHAPERLFLENHRAMAYASALVPTLSSVLDLGTGGGGFVRHFRHHYHDAVIRSVEASSAMVRLAERYFEIAPAAIIQERAQTFLARDQSHYDFISCDLFDGREAPAELLTVGFYEALANKLTSDGVLTLNLLPESEAQALQLLATVRAVFSGIGVLQFSELGNLVLVLCNAPLARLADREQALIASPYARNGEALLFASELHVLPS
ncbi:MAG: fused MFS/spermidine synthase [Pseudomonadota bacterium]